MATAPSVKKSLKSKRDWLEKQEQSGSYYALTVSRNEHVELTLADCHRTITWSFGRPNSKRAVAKIKKVKALVDEMYTHLVDPTKPRPKKTSWDDDY